MSSKEVESGLGILPLNPSANIGVAALDEARVEARVEEEEEDGCGEEEREDGR